MNINRRTGRKKIGELLIDEGLITEEQLQTALVEQQKSGGLLGEILVEMGAVSERDIARAITSQSACPYVSVLNHYISKEVLSLLPAPFLWKHQLIPLDRFGDTLTLVCSLLLSDELLDEIARRTGCKVKVFVSSSSEIRSALTALFPDESKNVLDKVFSDGEAATPSAADAPSPAAAAGKPDAPQQKAPEPAFRLDPNAPVKT